MQPNAIFNPVSRDNNINAVRYYLAICILVNHFNVLTGSEVFQLPRIFGGAGSFFAISGFLLFHSFEKRPSLPSYFRRRAARILPPYFFVVLLAAVALCAISLCSPGQYFLSPGFWKYLAANLSFLNFLEPTLPGVFTDATNLAPAVNGSLWTMKGEIACYLTVPLAYWLIKRYRRPTIILSAACTAFLGLFILFQIMLFSHDSGMWEILRRQALVMFLFYMGAMLNLHLDTLRRHTAPLIIVCGTFLMFHWANTYYLHLPLPNAAYFAQMLLHPLASGLMVIACSISGNWGRCLRHHDPFTYEIYLFHYPIIQTLLATGTVAALGPYPALGLAILLTSALAWLSYHFVSAPFIRH